MKISDALKSESTMVIPFGDESLTVVYRPSATTIQDIEALKTTKDVGRVAEQIRQQVVRWDLTDDYSNLIPLEPPSPVTITQDGQPVDTSAPMTPVDPLHSVPLGILVKVLIAIQTDQRPDPQA